MNFPPLLNTKYQQCDSDTKLLFDNLIQKSACFCTGHSAVDMKEFHYRLQKHYPKARGRKYQNYCLFTLTPSRRGVTIHLRTDGYTVDSEKFDIAVISESSYLRGKEWVKFSLCISDDIEEAIMLIKKVYEAE